MEKRVDEPPVCIYEDLFGSNNERVSNILYDLSTEARRQVLRKSLNKTHSKLISNQVEKAIRKADKDQIEMLQKIIDEEYKELMADYLVNEKLVKKDLSKVNFEDYLDSPEGAKDMELFLGILIEEKEKLLN